MRFSAGAFTPMSAWGGWWDERLVRFKLRRCTRVGAAPRVLGRVWIHGRGRIFLGDRVTLDARAAPIELHVHDPQSEIHLGDDVIIESGSSIEAVVCVRVDARCRLGRFTKVLDNHHHPLRGDRTQGQPSVPVELEQDAQVESYSILLPGAHLGRRVRVLANSVVSRKVPAGLVVAGLPASRVHEPAAVRVVVPADSLEMVP